MNNWRSSKWLFPFLLLCVGLVHGLIYVFFVPPWQHNDEPNHFEYVWLIAHRNALPRSTDYDPSMSRMVMQSMVAHHFFDGMGYVPDLSAGQSARLVGFSQLSDRPLYYLVASFPVKLLDFLSPNASIETQLYTARLTSLLFLLISIFSAWALASEFASPSSPYRWLVPLTLALWPGYVDLMTAVTNFAGAVAFFSLFLWFGIRLIRRGVKWFDIMGAVLTTVACYFTQSGVYIVFPLLVIVLLFSLFRGRWRWLVWVCLIISGVACVFSILTWGDADLWYRETWQTSSTRVERQEAPLGKEAFQLVVPSQGPTSRIYQLIPPNRARKLKEKTVTLGAWMWATHPLKVASPILQMDGGKIRYFTAYNVTNTPAFYAITATLTGGTDLSWVIISVPPNVIDAGTVVFFDGLVLAEGSYSVNDSPSFDNINGSKGTWGHESFVNLLRNASAETSGLRIRLWVDRHVLLASYERLSMVLYSLRDWSSTGWYFRVAAANLFRTMWGRFGWNHVPLLGHKPYRGLLLVTFVGMAGLLASTWHSRKSIRWEQSAWLILAVLMLVGITFISGVFYLLYKLFIPPARYIFPTMTVIVMALSAGWWYVLRVFDRWLPSWFKWVVYFTLFVGLDIYALASLISFYY